jgi:cold shock CspA family protein/cytidylate kinase
MQDIIAIYGSTCSLKTEVAQQLSRLTGFKVTNRGELATTRAKFLRLATAGQLSIEEHRRIDAETLRMAARDERLMIFESSLMDAVLRDVPRVFWVRLYADDATRNARWTRRKEDGGGRTRQLGESVSARDAEDAKLRSMLYASTAGAVTPAIEIDTSGQKAPDVAARIWATFEKTSGIQNVVTNKPEMDKSAARGINPGPASGVVRRFSAKQSPFGGYIADDRSGKEIYVHKSALKGASELAPGTRVEFQIVEDGFGGFKATNVTLAAA